MSSSQVKLEVSSSVLNPLGGSGNMKTFSKSLTIEELKKKLEMIVGTAPEFMEIQLRENGKAIIELKDNNATLGSYNPQDGMELFVIDVDPSSTVAQLQDVSKVEKYVMSDEKYEQREMTYKKWKESQKAAPKEEEFPTHVKVNDFVEVNSDDGTKEGTVMYVGAVDGAKGFWVGVKLNAPQGKNDGSVKGKRYFTCEPNYGLFVKPNKVTVKSNPTSTDEL